MPTLTNVKVLEAKEIWATPDKKRILYAIKVGTEHGEVELKTWSNQIAKEGWTGDLDTYEKEGKQGSETFAKQPLKEGGFAGGKSGKPQSDPRTMYISYAKDVVVALIGQSILPHEMGVPFAKEFDAAMEFIIQGGEQLQNGKVTPVDVVHNDDNLPSQDDLNEIFPE